MQPQLVPARGTGKAHKQNVTKRRRPTRDTRQKQNLHHTTDYRTHWEDEGGTAGPNRTDETYAELTAALPSTNISPARWNRNVNSHVLHQTCVYNAAPGRTVAEGVQVPAVWSPDRNTRHETKSRQKRGTPVRRKKPRPPTRRRHTCGSPAYDLQLNVGTPEEVQPATSDTVKVPTCQCLWTLSRLKYSGGLSSFGVGARWCMHESVARQLREVPSTMVPAFPRCRQRPPVTCVLAEPRLLPARVVAPSRAERRSRR